VRELKHCAERFVLANQRTQTSIQSILDKQPTPISNQPRNLRQHVEQFEKALIRQALVDKEGHIANVCDHLNIPRRTLNEKLLKYDLNRLDFIRK
jgi:DNA-binding NtrC family response regulator